jgi:RHS repeat-associated protein
MNDRLQIISSANPTASVTVNGNTAYRKGEYFRFALSTPNSSQPWYNSVTVASSYPPGASDIGSVFVAKTPELFAYDLDGNLTSDGRWSYFWDAENRLTNMVANTTVAPPQRIVFGYDWQGRRISKKVWNNIEGSGSPAVDQRFVYDGWNLIAVLNSDLTPQLSFTWGTDLSGTMQGAGGVGGLLAMEVHSGPLTGSYFYSYDGNGNVLALINAANGAIAARYEYGPFGELVRKTGDLADLNPFRFSTKYQDEETDLLYYGYRYYNASTGMWLNRDPLGEKGGKNLYVFVYNDANNHWDKLGQNPISPEKPPGNNIDPPPSGPFSKCRTALTCHRATADPTDIKLPFDHCALLIDTDDGVYLLNGSGGTRNYRWVISASPSDRTGPWTDNDPSVCVCLFANVKPWNDRNVPRNNTCANSNWNLKCALKKCSVQLDWGNQKKPIGYHCKECVSGSAYPPSSVPIPPPCCTKWREKPCPDE